MDRYILLRFRDDLIKEWALKATRELR